MDKTKKISYQSLKEKLSDNQLKRIIAGSGDGDDDDDCNTFGVVCCCGGAWYCCSCDDLPIIGKSPVCQVSMESAKDYYASVCPSRQITCDEM